MPVFFFLGAQWGFESKRRVHPKGLEAVSGAQIYALGVGQCCAATSAVHRMF